MTLIFCCNLSFPLKQFATEDKRLQWASSYTLVYIMHCMDASVHACVYHYCMYMWPNHHSKCFQNEIHIGWLPWSLLLVTAEHKWQSARHVLVGLWVPDSGDGQSNHAGGQQYLEQQSHSTGKVWSFSLSLSLSLAISRIALVSCLLSVSLSFCLSVSLSLSECCCVCHQGQICKKADLCLNLYPCVIKYYLIFFTFCCFLFYT